MDEAARICAQLVAQGAVVRAELPSLDHPAIREEVEERLRRCGLALATSAYSDHVGLRLADEASDATVLDAASNLSLGADACALLTVLWARLALQWRTAEDTRSAPGEQPALLPADRREASRRYAPSVRFETLAREFGAQLGGRTRLKALLGQLRRLGFVAYHHLDAIEAGPLLELGIDGERMVAFIRSRVLSRLLEARPEPEVAPAPAEPTAADRVLAAIASSPEPVGISAIERVTGIPRREIRRILEALRAERRIEMVGTRGRAHYRLARLREG